MQKEIKDLKRVKLVATILDPKHEEDEDYDKIVIEVLIPETEWDRLIYEGCFTWVYCEVIEGYKKYFASLTHIDDILIHFEEIEEPKEA